MQRSRALSALERISGDRDGECHSVKQHIIANTHTSGLKSNSMFIIRLQDHLFSGFDCTQQNAEVHIRTQTVSVCTPQVREERHIKNDMMKLS